jgi:hypothetical protein
MTAVAPDPAPRLSPAVPPRAAAGEVAPIDFASLLDVAVIGDGPKAGMTEDPGQAFAHVFNAFGFFAASGESRPSAVVESPADATPVVVEGSEVAGGVDAQSKGEGEEGEWEPAAPLFEGDARGVCGGDELPQVQVSGPGRLGAGAAPRSVPLPQPANIGWSRVSAPFSNAVRAGTERAARADPSPRRPDAMFAREQAGASGDRLVLTISGEHVELMGRLSGLGEEEEQRLIEALEDLLGRHGLPLGSARLNGRLVAGNFIDGER